MNDLISVIVPIYKVEKELPRCITSIIEQTYPYLEIILVNDGSPDCCGTICEEFASRDLRIIVINKQNGGLSDARNTGLRAATGKFIMYVDGDDYLEPEACEWLISGMICEDVDFVVGAYNEIEIESKVNKTHTSVVPFKLYSNRQFIINSIKANEWYAPAWLNLYKREFLIKNHLYFKVGQYYEDMELLPKLYLNAQYIVYIDKPFYNYVMRENSITTSIKDSKKTKDAIGNYIDWKILFDCVDDYELRKYLYGMQIKCYLKTCRDHKVTEWLVPGCGFKFSLKYALNLKEQLKVILFELFPTLYIKIG